MIRNDSLTNVLEYMTDEDFRKYVRSIDWDKVVSTYLESDWTE